MAVDVRKLLALGLLAAFCTSQTSSEEHQATSRMQFLKQLVASHRPVTEPATLFLYACGDSTIRNAAALFVDILPSPKPDTNLILAVFRKWPHHARFKSHNRTWGNVSIIFEFQMTESPSLKACLKHAKDKKQSLPPSTYLLAWLNFAGLHTLHLIPERGWAKQRDWASYSDLVKASANTVLDLGYDIVFQTTHSVCSKHYKGAWVDVLTPSYDPSACARAFSKLKHAREDCAASTMDEAGSARLHEQELAIYHAHFENDPRVRLLDAFTHTEGQCWATAMGDGRHYRPLAPEKVIVLLLKIQEMFRARHPMT